MFKNAFDWMILLVIGLFLVFTADKHWNPVSDKFVANQVKVIILKTDSYLHNVGYLCGYPTQSLNGESGEWFVSKKYTIIEYFTLDNFDLIKKEYFSCLKDLSKSIAIKSFSNYESIPSPKFVKMNKNHQFWFGFTDKSMRLEGKLVSLLGKDFEVKSENNITWVNKKEGSQ